ncbi:hypothetical protein BGX24_004142 [Mortierella sp. AD032]|nr:hypothetical protein BGX24_004142 [Mortierella sp. AD032]
MLTQTTGLSMHAKPIPDHTSPLLSEQNEYLLKVVLGVTATILEAGNNLSFHAKKIDRLLLRAERGRQPQQIHYRPAAALNGQLIDAEVVEYLKNSETFEFVPESIAPVLKPAKPLQEPLEPLALPGRDTIVSVPAPVLQ